MAGLVRDIADAEWQSEVLDSPLPVLVDFWTPTCPPCSTLAPTIERLAGDYQGRLKVVKVNLDQNIEVAGSLRISAMPTVLLFQGGPEVERMIGAKPEAKYRDALCQKMGVC
jgi:thioredoxin 1